MPTMPTKYTAGLEGAAKMAGWSQAWYIFAAYALVIAILFALLFQYKHKPDNSKA